MSKCHENVRSRPLQGLKYKKVNKVLKAISEWSKQHYYYCCNNYVAKGKTFTKKKL